MWLLSVDRAGVAMLYGSECIEYGSEKMRLQLLAIGWTIEEVGGFTGGICGGL